MKRNGGVYFGVLLAMMTHLAAAETGQAPVAADSADEWDKQVVESGKEAAESFSNWKASGKLPDDFEKQAVYGARADLLQRVFSGDTLEKTELKSEAPTSNFEVSLHDTADLETAITQGDAYRTVWRRLTEDRFEIWTPKLGKLYDAKGKKIAEAKVHRGDGWGREWYGAFLPDGRWITTDINEFDKEVTAFSVRGKMLWSVKGATLIPASKDPEAENPLSLIAWARSDQEGKAWIVAVGADRGRGVVKLKADGTSTKIDNPWKNCFPQQLRSRGMYIDRSTCSDDGALMISRTEAAHGMYVGWPHYHFSETSIMVPNGDHFGILPNAWSVFIESDCGPITSAAEDRKEERVWLFDAKGAYQHWIKGRTVGASLSNGGLWIRQLDDSCVLMEKSYTLHSHAKFFNKQKELLIPVELHDDIGLGLFLLRDKLLLGSWMAGKK